VESYRRADAMETAIPAFITSMNGGFDGFSGNQKGPIESGGTRFHSAKAQCHRHDGVRIVEKIGG
jgi:hypothetical protein